MGCGASSHQHVLGSDPGPEPTSSSKLLAPPRAPDAAPKQHTYPGASVREDVSSGSDSSLRLEGGKAGDEPADNRAATEDEQKSHKPCLPPIASRSAPLAEQAGAEAILQSGRPDSAASKTARDTAVVEAGSLICTAAAGDNAGCSRESGTDAGGVESGSHVNTDDAVAACVASTDVAAGANGLAHPMVMERQDNVEGAEKFQLRHQFTVNGVPLGISRVLGKSFGADHLEELSELLLIWQRQWHGFPRWGMVMAVRSVLLHENRWGTMSYPEKRGVAELYTILGKDQPAPYEQAVLRWRQQCGVRHASGGSQQLTSPNLSANSKANGHPAAATDAASAAGFAASGAGADKADSSSDNVRQSDYLINRIDVARFIHRHGLKLLNYPPPPASPDEVYSPPYMSYTSTSLDPLSDASGRAENLSARQVYEWIILPALEAAGGRSYIETYCELRDPKGRHATTDTRADPSNPKGLLVPVPPDIQFCELNAALHSAKDNPPLWIDMFCAGPDAVPALWGPAASNAGPGNQVPASSTSGPAAHPPRVPPSDQQSTRIHENLTSPGIAYCSAVAFIVGNQWPWEPMRPPPVFSCLATASQTWEAVERGLQPVLLPIAYRILPDFESGNQQYCTPERLPSLARVEEAAAAAAAHLAGPVCRPDGSTSSGVNSGAAGSVSLVPGPGNATHHQTDVGWVDPRLAAMLWRAYESGIEAFIERLRSVWKKMPKGKKAQLGSGKKAPPESPFEKGTAALRVERRVVLEAVMPSGDIKALVSVPIDEQQLLCPADMSQAETDELCQVWQEKWACMPDWATVLRTRALCGGSDPAGHWARSSPGQRRAACELVLLYGDAAATWRPSAEAEAAGRAASSRGLYVTMAFLDRFVEMHGFNVEETYPFSMADDNWGKDKPLEAFPGQNVWAPREKTSDMTTSWVCKNIVLATTEVFGMCYADLFLSAEAQAAFLPPGARRYCQTAEEAPSRVFASHAWATPLMSFYEALTVAHEGVTGDFTDRHNNQYWIDIFHKNQWQPVGISDLKDNLLLSGRVAAMVHPFPKPLLTTRVWCLYELMTALQLNVQTSFFRSKNAFRGFRIMMSGSKEMSPEVLAEVDAIDVAQAEATVPADKEMIMGMIQSSIGVDEMNREVRELFKQLLEEMLKSLQKAQQEIDALSVCFDGDGLVQQLVVIEVDSPTSPSAAEAQAKKMVDTRLGTAVAALSSATAVPEDGAVSAVPAPNRLQVKAFETTAEDEVGFMLEAGARSATVVQTEAAAISAAELDDDNGSSNPHDNSADSGPHTLGVISGHRCVGNRGWCRRRFLPRFPHHSAAHSSGKALRWRPLQRRRCWGEDLAKEDGASRARQNNGAATSGAAIESTFCRTKAAPEPMPDLSASSTTTTRLVRVADLRPGDRILTADGGVSTVTLVTTDPVGRSGMELCALPHGLSSGSGAGSGGVGASGCLLVTPDHPVRVGGVWRLPRDLAPVRLMSREQVPLGSIFNLELDPPAAVEVSGVVLVTLGQDSSGDERRGVDPSSDALFGWGWRENPQRAKHLAAQEGRSRAVRSRGGM